MKSSVSTFLVLSALAIGVGCKKKPTETASMVPVTEAPVSEAKAVEAPPHVAQMSANFQRVYFDFDKSALDDDSKSALSDNVKIMQEHPDVRIEIQGHADERGTTDYNLALGQRRAEAVTSYMKSQGVAASRIKVVSFGEEKPIDGSSNERAWSKNRRCEFQISYSPSGDVQGTTGG